jgi:hypothetical protein
MVTLNTGNSGNQLREAIIKTGKECQQEGAYCQYLGPLICPIVYGIIPNGYVMEKLEPAPRTPTLLLNIEDSLNKFIWHRQATPSSLDTDWREELKKYGVETPDWVISDKQCLVHGDPTVSNALIRGNSIVMCDPRPPRNYIPQFVETDMGRILQSMWGWEIIAYGASFSNFIPPKFWSNETYRKRAIFWCGAAAARIEYLERSRGYRSNILRWCEDIRSACNV